MNGKVFEENNELPRNSCEKLYLDSTTTDVNFVFNNGLKSVPAHKILLSAGSPVFHTMFYGSMKEKGDVNIADASVQVFKEFLQFFYLGKVRLTSGNIFQVANLCKKYEMNEALKHCETPMQKALTTNNMCTGYAVALLLEMKNVVKYCEKEIKQKASKILKSADFLECDQKLFNKILQLVLSKCNALLIINACMDWAKAKCERDKVCINPTTLKTQLKDSLDQIPFAELTAEQFNQFNAAYAGFFLKKDYEAIILRLMSTNTKINDPPKFHTLNCDRREMDRPNDFVRCSLPYMNCFSSNKRLSLTELYIGNAFLPLQVDYGFVKISLSHGKELTNEQITIVSNKTTHVVLSKPVTIKPNIDYYIKLGIGRWNYLDFKVKPLIDQVSFRGGVKINFPCCNRIITGLVFQQPID